MATDLDDSLAEAVSLGAISTTAKSIDEIISPDTDVDMYRFTVSTGQVVDFDIDTSLNGLGGLGSVLKLFNVQGQQLAFNDDDDAPGENVIGFDAYLRFTFSTGGTYFIGVSNANNLSYNPLTGDGDRAGGLHATGSYRLIVQALPIDNNDSISESSSLGAVSTNPITVNDIISPDIDVDTYRFTVAAGQMVDFDIDTTLNGPGSLGSFLRLFNGQGQQLAFNDDANAPGENVAGFDAYLRFTFVTAGTYYIGVSNNNNTFYNATTGGGDAAGGFNSIGGYQLTVQALPVDPDDSLSEANLRGAVSATPITVNASIAPDIDVDIYRFTVAAGQIVDFDIDTPLNGPGGLGSFLRLFNGQGQELAFNNDAAAPGESVVGFDAFLRFTFVAAGTYFIGVSNFNNTLYNPTTGGGDAAGGFNSIGDYQLIVQTAAGIPPTDPDDSIAEAVSLGVISTTPVIASDAVSPDVDVDIYALTVAAGQVVDFDIDTPLTGAGGLGSFLRLFNGQGQELAFNNDAAAPGENVIGFDAYLRFTFAIAGTYYIGVSNANNTLYNPLTGGGDAPGGQNATGSYQLVVQGLPVDPDDSLSEAPSLGPVSTTPDVVNDSITPDIDVDLYRFTVTPGQIVDFDIDTSLNGPGGLGSFLRLFNDQGQELAFNDDAAAPGEPAVGFDAYLRFTFATAGTFYIGVSNNSNTLYNPTTGGGDAAGGFNSIGSYQLIVQLAGASFTDPNDTISEATSLPALSTTPATVSASISPDIDVNMYRFTVAAGQAVDFDIDTAFNGPGGLGSFLRLFSSQGQQLAFNNDANAPSENVVGFDAYLRFTFAAAGTYYIGVSNVNNTLYDPLTGGGDTAGGQNATGNYQLIVQALPIDPDDSLAEAPLLGTASTTPVSVNAGITPDIDVDLYRFTVTAGQVVDFDIDTSPNGPGGVDSFLRLFNAQGQPLTFNNNAAAPGESQVVFDAYLRFTFAAAGTYYVGVSNSNNVQYDPLTGDGDAAGGFNSIGSYQLIMQALPPPTVATLLVTINVSSIPESNGTALGTVSRANAPLTQALVVTLTSSDTTAATVPPSVTIPANQSSAAFAITAVDDGVVDGTDTVTITATAAGFVAGSQSVQVTDSDAKFHNSVLPADVTDDGIVSAIDALTIINFINAFGAGPVPAGDPPPYYDVNSDNFIGAIDALMVINFLNAQGSGEGEGENSRSEAPTSSGSPVAATSSRALALNLGSASPITPASRQPFAVALAQSPFFIAYAPPASANRFKRAPSPLV